MAQWDVAYNWMLDNEDRARAYKVVPDAPPGAFAVSGINSASFPAEFDAIAKLMISERGPAVEAFYRSHFWNSWMQQIVSDDVAKRVMDAAVNMGAGTAVRMLQTAAGCPSDGKWGPATLAAVNSLGNALVGVFQVVRLGHYQLIVKDNPSLAHYLGTASHPGPWWIRAQK